MASTTTDTRSYETGLARGIRVLIQLISNVELPRTLEDEANALLAIRTLHQSSPLSAGAEALREELGQCVALVGRPEIENLLAWIDRPQSFRERLSVTVRTRPARFRLLLQLLGKAVVRVYHHELPALLFQGEADEQARRLDGLLRWLPRYVGSRAYFDLAGRYLAATQEVLLENPHTHVGQVSVHQFRSWSWRRQLLSLTGWRISWNRHHKTNPAWCGSRLEFRLARAGVFRTLGWRGGRLALRALRDMKYRSHSEGLKAWPLRRIALAVALLVVIVGGKQLIDRRIQAHVQSDHTYIEQLNGAINPGDEP
jgi:hypothetical protein